MSENRSVTSGIAMEWQPDLKFMAESFDVLGVNVKSFREPLTRAVRQVMTKSLQQNFDVGGRPTWQPLIDSTRQRKQKLGYSNRTLIATGALRRVAGQINLWKINRTEAAMQLPQKVWYGVMHQTGWTPQTERDALSDLIGGPARPWAVFQREDIGDIEEIFFEWIEERIERDIAAGRRSGF